MTNPKIPEYDVLVLGGGITGAAVLYVLSKYTNVNSLALIEKYPRLGLVNSYSGSNSQTLHFGDIETNYSLNKAQVVKVGAEMVAKYLERLKGEEKKIFAKSHKMVLAVGRKETDFLKKRFEEFRELFPKLRLIGREEVGRLEPEVTTGRSLRQEILALYSEDGYVVDYGLLSESFVDKTRLAKDKKIAVFLDTKVSAIAKTPGGYEVTANCRTLRAKVVIAALGAHSLLFAKSLGYGLEYLILPVAGNFYCSTRKILNGKVYTVQNDKLPFAAVHGDPNIHNPDQTRFGPTAKVLPILERRNYRTFREFIKSAGLDFAALASLIKVIFDRDRLVFIIQNLIYDLPFFGKRAFLRTVRKIIPKIKISDIGFGVGLGGIRPQLVDKKRGWLLLGEAEIVGDGIIFNVTPSPGATACLQNAEKTVKKAIDFLGGEFRFDGRAFNSDFKN